MCRYSRWLGRKPWLACPEPMMVTLLGAILLLGGIFVEPRLCPHHGRISLGENIDLCWVEQRCHFGAAHLPEGTGALLIETSTFSCFFF